MFKPLKVIEYLKKNHHFSSLRNCYTVNIFGLLFFRTGQIFQKIFEHFFQNSPFGGHEFFLDSHILATLKITPKYKGLLNFGKNRWEPL